MWGTIYLRRLPPGEQCSNPSRESRSEGTTNRVLNTDHVFMFSRFKNQLGMSEHSVHFVFGLLWFSTSYLPFGGVIWWYPPFSDKSRTFSSIFLDPVGKHLNILGQYLNWLETNVLEPTCTTGPRGLFHTTGWSRNHRTQGLEIPEVVVFFAGMVPQAANCRGFWMVRDACEPFVYAECIWYRLCTHKHYIYRGAECR